MDWSWIRGGDDASGGFSRVLGGVKVDRHSYTSEFSITFSTACWTAAPVYTVLLFFPRFVLFLFQGVVWITAVLVNSRDWDVTIGTWRTI